MSSYDHVHEGSGLAKGQNSSPKSQAENATKLHHFAVVIFKR